MRPAHLWPVLRILALILHVPAGMAAVSTVVALLAGNRIPALAFFTTALATAIAAQAMLRLPRGHRASVRETMVGAAVGWFAVALVGAAPMFWAGLTATPGSAAATYASFWNALFESMSGFTTTGLSMVKHPSALPASLLWWRSFMQWVGGAGIVVLVLTVLHTEREAGMLFHAEAHDQTIEQDLVLTLHYIWWVYLTYTVAGVLLLWLVGMAPWEALNYGLTAIATGGFAATDHSLADFGPAARLAVCGITIVGAVSFITHAGLFRRDWQTWRNDLQLRALLVLLFVGIPMVVAILWHESGRLPVLDAVVQTVSALATAGFSTVNVGNWSTPVQLFLVIAMLIGGSAGSTAGGIKLSRFVTLAETVWGYVRQIALEPHKFVYRPGELPGEVLPGFTGRIAVAVLLLVLTLGAVVIGASLLFFVTPQSVPFSAVIFDVVSAISLVGLSAGITGPEMHWLGKAVLIVLMWMGRLEILPVLVVIAWLIAPDWKSEAPQPATGQDGDGKGTDSKRSGAGKASRGGGRGRKRASGRHRRGGGTKS